MRILIADDSALFRLLLKKLLADMGYDVVVCEDGRAACEHLRRHDAPQMAILDWMMPELDGLQVCQEIRQQSDRPYVYVLLLTAKNAKDDLLRAFEAGVDDFLTKPVDAEELKVRLRAAQRILAWQEQLIKAQEQLRIQATRDALTGLWNRRAVFDMLDMELSRGNREGKPVGVAMLDLDNFKQINDTFGHQAGDAVLQEIGVRLMAWLRPYDQIGRCGGEEFLVILTGCDEPSVLRLCERLRARMSVTPVEFEGKTISLTLSIGAAMADPALSGDARVVIRSADLALYRAKANGRNRVELGTVESSD
jgi:diguanylate cyclase (GGDEF)-like protein